MPLPKDEEDSKEQIMADAMLIIHSVGFLEKQIHQALGELQEAVNNHFEEDADKIEARIRFLIKKTNDENSQMDKFLAKYKDKINEKKAILFNSQQEKQAHNGGISAQQRRTTGRAAVQGTVKKEEQGFAVNH